MMEHVYAFGVICIEFVQKTFEGWDELFYQVNSWADPHNALHLVFPLVSAVDSVFAAQLLLTMAFGQWFNAITKWVLGEHRPYWWVQETSYYSEGGARPVLAQHPQTCETGPGSPSGHSAAAAAQLLLLLMWTEHVLHDRKARAYWWWGKVSWGLCGAALALVMLARVYVAAHFPHQCLLGAATGIFLTPALCLYVNDPLVWRLRGLRGLRGGCVTPRRRRAVLVAAALGCGALAALLYWALRAAGVDPQWSVLLAFRWCRNPDSITVTTTPLFALVQACGALLGYAAAASPALASYRHYSGGRALWLALPLGALAQGAVAGLRARLPQHSVAGFYLAVFALDALQPLLFLRLLPLLARLPYYSATATLRPRPAPSAAPTAPATAPATASDKKLS